MKPITIEHTRNRGMNQRIRAEIAVGREHACGLEHFAMYVGATRDYQTTAKGVVMMDQSYKYELKPKYAQLPTPPCVKTVSDYVHRWEVDLKSCNSF